MENSQPLVSIITGYYNRRENLNESIQSVLDQDYENFEFIVFDDCSTDGTKEMLERFDDPRLKLIKHSKNLGFTKGIIQAISIAKGKYIAIHGAGDISFTERIRKQVELLEANPEIGIVGSLIEDVYDGTNHLFSPVGKNGAYYFSQGEVMYRKTLYFEVGGYNSLFKYGQFTMLKLDIMKISQAASIDEVLYRRIHYSNGVTRNSKKRLEQQLFIMIGKLISARGIWTIDLSSLIIAVSFQNIELVKQESEDEKRLLMHLNTRYFYKAIYLLYKKKLIAKKIIKKTGTFIRKRKNLI